MHVVYYYESWMSAIIITLSKICSFCLYTTPTVSSIAINSYVMLCNDSTQ